MQVNKPRKPMCITGTPPPTCAPLFVLRTPGGSLARKLRNVEAELCKVTRRTIKVVEKSGPTVRELLLTSDSWENEPCDRQDYSTCTCQLEAFKGKQCKVWSVVYETVCLDCLEKGVVKKHIGETHATAFERFKKQKRDTKNPKAKSHIREHKESAHPERADCTGLFAITVRGNHYKAIIRQIREALDITNMPGLLNSKEEWRRSQIHVL